MDLQMFVDLRVKQGAFASPSRIAPGAWAQVHATTDSEGRTDPAIAAVLSQIVMLSTEFENAMLARGLEVQQTEKRDVFLLRKRGTDAYVIVIADSEFVSAEYFEEVRLD